MSESGPVQGLGSSHFLEMPSDVFEAKGEVDNRIPSGGGIEPRILPNGAEIHATTLWHFWRAPPWPPANPY
jgi:hypothetical protein